MGNEKLIQLLSQTDPDVIVITGDLIDSRHTDLDVALEFVWQVGKIARVYYVSGNHEARVPEYEDLKIGLLKAGVVILENQKVQRQLRIYRMSLTNIRSCYLTGPSFSTYMSIPGWIWYSAVMPTAASFPLIGGLITPNQGFFPEYDAGHFTEENTTLIVSRGVGNSIIPVRFNNRPEIIVVELKKN